MCIHIVFLFAYVCTHIYCRIDLKVRREFAEVYSLNPSVALRHLFPVVRLFKIILGMKANFEEIRTITQSLDSSCGSHIKDAIVHSELREFLWCLQRVSRLLLCSLCL